MSITFPAEPAKRRLSVGQKDRPNGSIKDARRSVARRISEPSIWNFADFAETAARVATRLHWCAVGKDADMLRTFLIAAAVFSAGQLQARQPDYPVGRAQLEWHHDPLDKVILDNLLWRCAADQCSGPVPTEHRVPLARQCRQLAKYGRVISFHTPSGALSSEALERCNR